MAKITSQGGVRAILALSILQRWEEDKMLLRVKPTVDLKREARRYCTKKFGLNQVMTMSIEEMVRQYLTI